MDRLQNYFIESNYYVTFIFSIIGSVIKTNTQSVLVCLEKYDAPFLTMF